MRKIYALFIIVISLFFSKFTFAQSGELDGKIIDGKNNQGIPFANVVLFQNDVQKSGAQTDLNGNYVMKPLDPGSYTLKVSYVGYENAVQSNIEISAEKITVQNITLTPGAVNLTTVVITQQKLVDPDMTSTGSTVDATQINDMATRGINNEIANTAGVTQTDEGSALNINGGRSSNAKYYVDGIPVFIGASATVPTSSIEQIEVISGGIPAKYGNVTSGVINITTKGPSKTFNGSVDLETSQFLDSYGYDLGSFDLSGPVYTKYKKTDSARTKIGFFLSGQVEHALNGSFGDGGNTPPAFPIYTVKPDVMQNLELNPIQPSPAGTGFVPSAESLTMADLTTSNYDLGVPNTVYTVDGKLTFQFTNNLLLSVGGSLDYQSDYGYNYADQLLDPNGQQYFTIGTYRLNAKFTQLFNSGTGNNGSSVSVFQNGYYSIQADYSDVYQTVQDKQFGSNIFDYGYVGKFQDYNTPVYQYGQDTIAHKTGFLLQGYEDTLIKFTPGTENPLLANYTKEYYTLAGSNVEQYYSNLNQIQGLGGLINGGYPGAVYSMYNDVGAPSTGYSYTNNAQYHFAINGSVDIVNPYVSDKDKKKDKGRHAIEFGIEYQQKNNKAYGLDPIGLWGLMRQLTNPTNDSLDTRHPHPVYDQYGAYKDTINYSLVNNNNNYFDQQLTQKLGLSSNTPVYVDEYGPSTFSLNMFSPDELANNADPFFVFYYGYNYLGQNLSQQPKFNDFFTQTDANGNYTRNNPAFTPNISSAYIQDKFRLNDIIFNVGVRVDRYDADEEQLKDPYLLYPAYTANEVTSLNGQPVSTPSNIPGSSVVYVNNIADPTQILGYRNGNQWYLANGQATSDPGLIAQQTTTGTIQPYLIGNQPIPALTGSSFTNTTPAINVMPRVAFSFPISDEVMFFAHYDVLTEEPLDFGGNTLTGDDVTATPFQYYYLKSITTDYQLTNPALVPQKTIDYQVGYQQQLGLNSAIEVSLLYKDMQDMVDAFRYVYAYPYDYNTFSNIDFGTVKSLLVSYNMRRTRNIELGINYTLQFAEGTGSGITSQLGQLSESNPNLQVITPFSYDQRHTITGNIDYRFGEGRNYNGPRIGKKQTPILQNFGVNLLGTAFSGTPYTAQQNVLPTVLSGVAQRAIIAGNINGSRLPWSYRLNLKVDKAFGVNVGKSKNNSNGKNVFCDVYLLVTNLLNTENILGVYAYTGNANDDGYLESAAGKQYVSQQDFPTSFSTLYQIREDNPGDYSQPRTIHLGLQVSF